MPRRSGTRPASRCPLKRLSRDALVGFHCRVQLGHRHPLVVAMSDVDRSGTEQVRASPLRQLGNVRGVRGDACLESWHYAEPHRRNGWPAL